MVRTDWDRILSVNPSSLTDDEIEELCPAVIRCDADEIGDVHSLRTLMKLSQEMLQYKDNQVESLLLECGELKQTISSLKPEATKRKKKEWDGSDTKHETTSISKLTELSDNVNYEEALQGKNKKIKILMTELESLEKENLILKERLTILTQEMEDATDNMNEMTEQFNSAQVKAVEWKEKISYLERENVALATQIEEITAQQLDRDKVIDEFSVAIDARIAEWKAILDEKDAEIIRLKESLSQSLGQSVTTAKEQSKPEIIRLNEEIDRRDKIIAELQTKLSEAVFEINESTTLIEKLKADIQMAGKTDKRKEHKDLLKKLQDAHEKISDLQNELLQAQEDVKAKSSKLCEVLSTLRQYEDENQGLTQALRDIKELKIELDNKNEHVKDLINIVNKLEMLNSYQEMEILSLREKLGIPEDESISIQKVLIKRKEEAKKMEELVQQNKILAEENLELKSNIRMLKYISKSTKELDFSGNVIDGSGDFLHSTKLPDSEARIEYPKIDTNEFKQNTQPIIEENEALRTGMHEILDSIRNQDGKSIVEIQSSTLERLLEALDVRHLAGWYHPAMRLQEHLNVVQGSNNELRSQLKQLRKELQRKDTILQNLALNKNADVEKLYMEESENEKLSTYIDEVKKMQEAYQNEKNEWGKEMESLIRENEEMRNEVDKLKLQLEIYQQGFKILEEGDNEIQKDFAIKTKEYIDVSSEALMANRKNTILQQLLNKETTKAYEHQKEAIKNQSNLKKTLADLKKHNEILECEISTIRSNLLNSVSNITYNELKERHDELSIRYRNILENNIILQNNEELQKLKDELESANREKYQLIEQFRKEYSDETDKDVLLQLKEARAKELVEQQRADHIGKLYEISQSELSKCKDSIKEILTAKSELQDELIVLHKRLSREVHLQAVEPVDENKIQELKDNNATLKAENENLKKLLEVSKEEAQLQYSLNTLKTLELDNLRHQNLNLLAISEDKVTISQLDFELTSKKMSEMELSAQNVRLENEVSYLQEELEKSKKICEELRIGLQDCRKQCEYRCRMYTDVITFLQNQYAGCTCISALDKVLSLSKKLKEERGNIDIELKKTRECHESVKAQQEMLNNRLQIVERLKDILEQQIGSNSVQNVMQRFSEYSQHTLNDFKYKRKIAQLEYELQIANNKFVEYETTITNLEHDMVEVQKTWSLGQVQQKVDTQSIKRNSLSVERESVAIQTIVETKSTEVQTDPYVCCLNKKELVEVEVQVTSNSSLEDTVPKKEDKSSEEIKDNNKVETDSSVAYLHEQLNQALKTATERSVTLMKYETQIAEYQHQLNALNKTIKSKDSKLTEMEKLLEEYKLQSQTTNVDCSDKLALRSMINSLQKLVSQKEETIGRYQNLLKEDRDEHSRAASRLQEEIKCLHSRIQSMQSEMHRGQQRNDAMNEGQKFAVEKSAEIMTKDEPKNNIMQEEEVARLCERISTLEADLNITKELSDRWHRLAQERLNHMDRMRERLEEQHKSELEIYRAEINKWQTEADGLRKQLFENRKLLTKGNISLMKELQERDDKIHELGLTCQQLQNEVELMASTARSQQAMAHDERETKIHQITQTFNRDQVQQQSQTDLARKQLQSLMEKEKLYKHEIADLKQRLSRSYMTVKSQEKKTSQREVQLERKVKSLEEELQKTRAQLDREYLAQEAKKAKTAEELSLWEKQKKWQQTAEKLKEKLKEKTDEYAKLLVNYEKLRGVVACMEREKWYLRSKLKLENSTIAGNLSARPISAQQNLVEELQKECQTLRDRIKELTNRLENEDNEQLVLKMEEQKRRIAALETVSQGNGFIISQLEKLEMTKDILEKMNLKLESENLELRFELEKANSDTPTLREKVEHLEKYVELLKIEKSSDSTPRSSDKELQEHGMKKSTLEMEKTIFTLKRIVEKLQAENKRLKINSKKNHFIHQGKSSSNGTDCILQTQYEEAQKRIITLETDLQLAEQRVDMLERTQKEEDNGDLSILRRQLIQKSELLDKVKNLLSKAATNEKSLRQRIQHLESRQTLSTIPECYVIPSTPK